MRLEHPVDPASLERVRTPFGEVPVVEAPHLRWDQAFWVGGATEVPGSPLIVCGEVGHVRHLMRLATERAAGRHWLEDLLLAFECEARGMAPWQVEQERYWLPIFRPTSFVELTDLGVEDPPG